MDWLHSFHSADQPAVCDPGIPKRLLRHLVKVGRILVGTKVLDAGCGRGELTRFLDDLSIEASGIDDSAESIAAARNAAGHLNYHCGRASQEVPFPERHFHVVLARNLPEHRNDLFGHAALLATAHLLTMVHPEGCLILMTRLDPRWATQPSGHTLNCFREHLESFPGACQVSYLVDSMMQATTWNWMLGRQPRAGYITAVLTLSKTARTCREWEQMADEAAGQRRPACCAWTAQNPAVLVRETAPPARFAA